MASISFNGTVVNYTFVGGIIGQIYLTGNGGGTIRNCVNYGIVSYTGCSGRGSMLGGIVGELYGKSITNCLNYGTIIHYGSDDYTLSGGIAGKSHSTVFESCVSAGLIVSSSEKSGVGNIVSAVQHNEITNITNCYWTNKTNCTRAVNASNSNCFIANSSETEMNSTMIEKLNGYHSGGNNHNKWILNPNGRMVTFKVNGEVMLSISSQIIFLPDLSGSSEFTFSGWFNDSECSNKFTSLEILENITLYAQNKGSNHIITFITDGQTIKIQELPYLSNISYPNDPSKTGYTFIGWNASIDYMPNYNVVIEAIFFINNYTVTFDFENGTVINTEYQYGEEIIYPGNLSRKGYQFFGWNDTISLMPHYNITIRPIWNETTNFVEIVLDTKDLSKDEIKTIIKEIIDDDTVDFVIEKFDIDEETGETKIIIKFNDKEKAENFVDNINYSSEAKRITVKKVNFITDPLSSFSIKNFNPVTLGFMMNLLN